MSAQWTLGDIRRQQLFLYAGCPDNQEVLVLLDLARLIQDHGVDFDILGSQLEESLKCPCGHYSHRPKIGVGETALLERKNYVTRGDPAAGAVPFDDAVKHILEVNRVARETNSFARAQHEKLQADLAKIRERKAKRRARNPYDFS